MCASQVTEGNQELQDNVNTVMKMSFIITHIREKQVAKEQDYRQMPRINNTHPQVNNF